MFNATFGRTARATLAVGALAILLVTAARGEMIAQYQFGSPGQETTNESSPAFAATTVAVHATATAVQDPRGTVGIEISSAATTPARPPYLRLDPQGNSATAAAAITNNKFYAFTIAPDAGFEFDLATLQFNVARGGASTPRGYVVRSSADDYAADLASANIATARPTYTPVSIDLSGTGFQNLTSGLTFRIYSYSPGAGSSVDYDDLTVNGSVVAVPEPSTLAGLIALTLLGAVIGFRRRMR